MAGTERGGRFGGKVVSRVGSLSVLARAGEESIVLRSVGGGEVVGVISRT